MKMMILVLCLMCAQVLSTDYDPKFEVVKITKFEYVWSDRGSGGKIDISIWKPIPDTPDVHPISYVVAPNYDQPK